MTKTISIANQKGGVGKTTTAITMAAILKSKGFNVLLIDTDAQCNSSMIYGAQIEDEATLFDVILAKNTIDAGEAIQKTEKGDIIPSDFLLRNADITLKGDVLKFKNKIDEIKKLSKYDYIIIDTNPALNSLLYSALVASDDVIIPVEPAKSSIEGLVQLRETTEAVRENENKDLKIAGILITKFNERTRLGVAARDTFKIAAEHFNTILFSTEIRRSQKVPDAEADDMTLIEYAKGSTSAVDYVSFVEEYLKLEEKHGDQTK